MTKEALKLALEALETPRPFDSYPPLWRAYEKTINEAITAIKEALAQPEQEPVASCNGMPAYEGPLSKTQRTWIGLTTDDWDEIRKQVKFNFEMTTGEYAERVSHLVEDKLREKNT